MSAVEAQAPTSEPAPEMQMVAEEPVAADEEPVAEEPVAEEPAPAVEEEVMTKLEKIAAHIIKLSKRLDGVAEILNRIDGVKVKSLAPTKIKVKQPKGKPGRPKGGKNKPKVQEPEYKPGQRGRPPKWYVDQQAAKLKRSKAASVPKKAKAKKKKKAG